MCIFCAAIPITAAIGARVQTQQRHQTEEAKATGQPAKQRTLSAGQITGIVVAGLAVGSVIYHTHFSIPI